MRKQSKTKNFLWNILCDLHVKKQQKIYAALTLTIKNEMT